MIDETLQMKWAGYLSPITDRSIHRDKQYEWVYAKENFMPWKVTSFKDPLYGLIIELTQAYTNEMKVYYKLEKFDKDFFTPREYQDFFERHRKQTFVPFKIASSNNDKYIEFVQQIDDTTFNYKCYFSLDDKTWFCC